MEFRQIDSLINLKLHQFEGLDENMESCKYAGHKSIAHMSVCAKHMEGQTIGAVVSIL